MQGEPFKYFAYGAAATEVEVDGFTGASRMLRVDILHDVGDSSRRSSTSAGRGRVRAGGRVAHLEGTPLG
jgi:xanthine dehydrogenase molybdopterin-binding subunit B